jgi:hypothetical protein
MLVIVGRVPHDSQRCKQDVVHLVDISFIHSLPAETTPEPKVKLHNYIKEVLVKVEHDKVRVTTVALTSMY